MTIEERADAYVGHPEEIDEFTTETIKRDAFIDGAQWMQSELIEKAVEWFKNQKEEIGISWYDDFEIRFREAMEE